MSTLVCIILGCVYVLLPCLLTIDIEENIKHKNFAGSTPSIVILIILSLGTAVILHMATKGPAKIDVENCHTDKVELIVTTIQSNDNIIKRGITYHYKY